MSQFVQEGHTPQKYQLPSAVKAVFGCVKVSCQGKKWCWIPLTTILLALAWTAHFNVQRFGHGPTFCLCFLALLPLHKAFDWGGDELGRHFRNRDLKDLLVITLSNAIEAALAVILLFKCHLRLLQSTLIGVMLLNLLLVPGTAFFIRGAQLFFSPKTAPKKEGPQLEMPEQKLHQYSSLNHSLSMT
ncbi:hypothetical protein BD309DRAFT_453719 [Dichomitus squalens]|nr:hypothetical protein BD309DRAFT_453719 [Dichomitus squalens]